MQMTKNIPLKRILFLDIECVSTQASYQALSEDEQYLWGLKARSILRDPEADQEAIQESYTQRAGIFAEFGKVVCISVGFATVEEDGSIASFRLKSFKGDDEHKLLTEFADLLNKHFKDSKRFYFCGHNIKEFDIPYICRRMLIHRVALPEMLDIAGRKPWETAHLLDTMEMWKFGDRKNFTSLKLLANVLGFPSPKDDIDGSEVGRVFWEEGDVDRIAVYCEKDVLATAQLYLRLNLQPLIEAEKVVTTQ